MRATFLHVTPGRGSFRIFPEKDETGRDAATRWLLANGYDPGFDWVKNTGQEGGWDMRRGSTVYNNPNTIGVIWLNGDNKPGHDK